MLTISRTGFASLIVLTFFSFYLNVRNQWTARKIGIAAVIVVVGSIMVFKAWDSLSRYKFLMFGHHAAQWVALRDLLPGKKPRHPWSDLVIRARTVVAVTKLTGDDQ